MMKLDIQLFANPKLVIETELNKKGFESGLNKIEGIAKKGFQGIAVATGVAATAMVGLVAKSVQAAGELEQQIGGTEAVFGEFAKTVQGLSKAAFTNMGLSANDYMATINKMGALMQGSGISIKDSMDLSAKAMQRAADVASIMGIDINSAMESIAGAAKGNFTMMDNLGVAMNATTIEAYALSKGIEKSYNEMDNAEKVGLAMEMFLEKTSYATGNYVKENETFAGSLSTLKASFENFLSGAGDVQPLIDSVVRFGRILVKTIGEMAPELVKGIVQLVKEIVPQIPPLLEELLPVVIDGAVELINGLVDALPTLIPILLNAIVDAFDKIVDVLPDIIEALIQAFILIVNALAEKAPDLIPKIVDAIFEIIPILIDSLPLFIEAGWKLIIGIGKGLLKAIPVLVSHAPKVWNAILNYFKTMPGKMLNIGKDLVRSLWNGIQNVKQWIFDKISDFANGITKKIKKIFGIKSPSKVFRDEIGKNLALGLGEGFEDNLDNVYRQMQGAIDLEQDKLQASVETGRIFNTIQNSTPIKIAVDGDVNLDGTKVGRLITPVVSQTIKSGGGR